LRLRSKNPGESVGANWQNLRVTSDDVSKHFNGSPQNIGILLGAASRGLSDVDLDCPEALALGDGFLPKTPALFGRKSTRKAHRLYVCPDLQHTHQFKDVDGAMLVELRGPGGQTVFPPSVHPEGEHVEWDSFGTPPEIPEAELLPPVARLAAACLITRHWPAVGGREDAAMALSGMLLRAGWSTADVQCFVRSVAFTAGDEECEKRARSVADTEKRLIVGEQATGAPRLAELIGEPVMKLARKWLRVADSVNFLEQTRGGEAKPKATTKRPKPPVLIPGTHPMPEHTVEVSTDDFSRSVLDSLPKHSLFRRGDIPGEILGDAGSRRFAALTVERTRILIDRHLRLSEWVFKKLDEEHVLVFIPCTQDQAKLVLGRALDHEKASVLQSLTRCPSFVGAKFERVCPGFNERHGVYFDEHPHLRGFDVIRDKAEIDAVLRDLLVDFPFQSEIDWQNEVGLLVLPIVRPSLVGNLPLHLVLSCLERSGKTKLVELVLGISTQGSEIPALTLTEKEEEREKRILALLLAGTPIVHLDNLPPVLDSAVLSSLLTATYFTGRVLSFSKMATLRNDVIFVGSGNNVRASGEIAKRIVPIRLLPKTATPELRTEFRHPKLDEYLRAMRPTVLGALHGMVQNWLDAGRPPGTQRFGGFEHFTEVIGGVLSVQGYNLWLSNREEWVGDADLHGGDLAALVQAWSETSLDWLRPAEVLSIAIERELFPEITLLGQDHQRRTLFGRRVLMAATKRPVGRWRIEAKGEGSSRRYKLVPLAEVAS
jgi:hypothetical protein